MIKVTLQNFCTAYQVVWDGELTARELLLQFIHTASDDECYDILEEVVELYGEYENLGECEQCFHTNSHTVLEIKDIND